MRLRFLLPALLLLVPLAPSAVACHPDPCNPECFVPDTDCTWDDAPFGVLPFATRCAGSAASLALWFAGNGLDYVGWARETADEILNGC